MISIPFASFNCTKPPYEQTVEAKKLWLARPPLRGTRRLGCSHLDVAMGHARQARHVGMHTFNTDAGWRWSPTPLKNMSLSVGMIIPNWMEELKMFQTTNQNVYVCSIHIMHLHFLLLFVLLANLLQGLWRRPFPRRSRGYHKQAERSQGISRLSPRLQPARRTNLTLTPFKIRMALGTRRKLHGLAPISVGESFFSNMSARLSSCSQDPQTDPSASCPPGGHWSI